jgi:hypothetical protein
LVWERRLRSILLEQVGKVELRLRSAIVESLGGENGQGYLDEENYDVASLKNKVSAKSRYSETEWDWYCGFLHRSVLNAENSKDHDFIDGHLNKHSGQHLPLWILAETLDFGELLSIYEVLTPRKMDEIASQFANPVAIGGELKGKEFAKILEALRVFRNRASHFHVIFDKSYPFPSLTSFRPKFRESDFFPSLSRPQAKGCSLYEIILMLVFLEPSFQRDSSWPGEVKEILQGFPRNIQGLTEETYGAKKGWHLTQPWCGENSEIETQVRSKKESEISKKRHTQLKRKGGNRKR